MGKQYSNSFLEQPFPMFKSKELLEYKSEIQSPRKAKSVDFTANIKLTGLSKCYFNYLQQLCANVEIIHCCKMQQYPDEIMCQ